MFGLGLGIGLGLGFQSASSQQVLGNTAAGVATASTIAVGFQASGNTAAGVATGTDSGPTRKWLPSDDPAVKVWLRADLGIHIGTGVSQWDNQVAGIASVVQATGSKQPTVSAAALNGCDVLTFASASSQFLRSASEGTLLAQPLTSFVVGRVTGTTAGSQFFVDGFNANRNAIFSSTTTFPLPINVFAGTTQTVASKVAQNTWNIWEYLANGASSTLLQNGNNVALGGTTGTQSLGPLSVGAASGGTGATPLNGQIAEIVIGCTTAAIVRHYFADRYGLTVS